MATSPEELREKAFNFAVGLAETQIDIWLEDNGPDGSIPFDLETGENFDRSQVPAMLEAVKRQYEQADWKVEGIGRNGWLTRASGWDYYITLAPK
jgi:hypothetical protein